MIYTSVLYGFYSLSPKSPGKSTGKVNKEIKAICSKFRKRQAENGRR
jgi:hypothetical protein